MPASQTRPLKIVLLTDVFPPGSGGSGWSTYYLGKALAERGHSVRVIRPRSGSGVRRPAIRRTSYGGLAVDEVLVPSAPTWAHRSGLEKVWVEQRAATLLARRACRLITQGKVNVMHAQHKVTAMAASQAVGRSRRRGGRAVAVATVRDYWPLCPVSTRLFANGAETFECRDCHNVRDSLMCAGVSATSPDFLLELARWIATWQSSRLLARCDMVIGVSRYVRDELALSGRIPGDRLVDIPNLVDLPSVARALQGPWPLSDISPEEPFLLFVGKWDTNKGAHLLPEVVARSGVRMPVVLAGDGPLERKLREDAAALSLDFRFVPWLDNDAVLRLMGASRVLVFPSAWQEPLSRVLLEGCAAGAAIAAMNTGGTGDIIAQGESGWLASDAKRLAEGVRTMATDDALNASLRLGARKKAETTFAAPVVSAQVEDLYLMLLEQAEKA